MELLLVKFQLNAVNTGLTTYYTTILALFKGNNMYGNVEKMLEKKGKKLSPIEGKAKKDVLSGLSDEMGGKLGERLSGLKKVSVAAPSKEGLEEGLDKAKELLGDMPEEESEDDGEHEMPSGEMMKDEDMAQYADCSAEELQAKINMLMKLKEEKLEEKE